MRLTELLGRKAETDDGESLGRVHEVHCNGGKVTALQVGAASFLETLTARTHGKRVAWDRVREIGAKRILVRSSKA